MSKLCVGDYDCIGFDLDMTLARYKLTTFNELIYNAVANYLVTEKKYRADVLLKPIDLNFIAKGLIIDSENGNLIKIARDGAVIHAAHGTKWLSEEEILKYYPLKHWKLTDLFIQDPAINSDKNFTLLGDYLFLLIALIFARAVDSVDKDKGVQKNYTVFPDVILAARSVFFGKDLCQNNLGLFPLLKKNPELYFHKCSDKMIDWMKELKKNGKKLFLVTGAYIDHASFTAESTLGKDWKSLFDIIVSSPDKITYFTNKKEFVRLEGFDEKEVVEVNALKIGETYMYGNSESLTTFMGNVTGKTNPKILYVGDNVIQDVYAANIYSGMDTISICEELEAEKVFGFSENDHPDREFICSSLWGSFFSSETDKDETFLYHFIKKYAKICVPSVEYLAKFPIDHTFNFFNI